MTVTRLEARRDGCVLDVLAEGPADGHPVVLLHGFPGSDETWRRVRPLLHDRGFRTYALVQRGYGRRARPASVRSYRLDELRLDVMAAADVAALERFHLVGHDWGALVAWGVAASSPERVSSLTALSAPHPGAYLDALPRSLQLLRSSYAVAWQLPAVPERLMLVREGAPLRALLRASGLDGEMTGEYVRLMRMPGVLTGALAWYRAAARHLSAFANVGGVEVPTVYAWGERDVSISRSAAERTADHVRGPYRFAALAGAGHWLPERMPVTVAELVGDVTAGRNPPPR